MNSIITFENEQYVMTLSDGSRLLGLDAIMNYGAASGWELVTLVPITYEGPAGAFGSKLKATEFVVTFKRYQRTPPQGHQSSQPGIVGVFED